MRDPAKVLIVCPTERDRRELERLAVPGGFTPLFWEESTAWPALFEQLACGNFPEGSCGPDSDSSRTRPPRFDHASLERMATGLEALRLSGVGSTDDYPGTLLSALLTARLSLPGPSVEATLLCQHKLLGRQHQQRLVPDCTPRFTALYPGAETEKALLPAGLPLFAKPAKSFFSIGAGVVNERAELEARLSDLAPAEFFHLLDSVAGDRFSGAPTGRSLLVEEIARGRQITLDGFVSEGEVRALGIVDSVMYPGTICFQRFEYPSAIGGPMQQRVVNAAERFLRGIGFDSGCFNAEFIVDEENGRCVLLEVNPRLSSQFSDLFEKVDGMGSYEVFASLCTGAAPAEPKRQGRYRFAASCVLRRFTDGIVERMPGRDALSELEERHPGIRIELLAGVGQRLSSILQDGYSFRYGVINLGGSDRAEILDRLDDCLRTLDIRIHPEP